MSPPPFPSRAYGDWTLPQLTNQRTSRCGIGLIKNKPSRDVETLTINHHLKKRLQTRSWPRRVIRKFLITAADGKGHDTKRYHLGLIIAVGACATEHQAATGQT